MQELTAEVVFKSGIKIFIVLGTVSIFLIGIWMFFGDYLKRKLKRSPKPRPDSSKSIPINHKSADSYSQTSSGSENIVLAGAATSDFTSSSEMGTYYGSSNNVGASDDSSAESGGSDSGGYEGGGDYGGGGSGGGWS